MWGVNYQQDEVSVVEKAVNRAVDFLWGALRELTDPGFLIIHRSGGDRLPHIRIQIEAPGNVVGSARYRRCNGESGFFQT